MTPTLHRTRLLMCHHRMLRRKAKWTKQHQNCAYADTLLTHISPQAHQTLRCLFDGSALAIGTGRWEEYHQCDIWTQPLSIMTKALWSTYITSFYIMYLLSHEGAHKGRQLDSNVVPLRSCRQKDSNTALELHSELLHRFIGWQVHERAPQP